MKADPRHRLRVCEAALKRIDAALGEIRGDVGGAPVDEIFSAIGAWREGLIIGEQ